MSIDGIMLAAIKNDLDKQLPGGRIDKIYQIDDRTITMLIRQDNQNKQLLISASPQQPRIHITENDYENPRKPPDFCMLLRKYLLRGVITKIEQPDFERILQFEIQSRKDKYLLFVEVMGKYSNISLVDEEGRVLDAIKRITPGISRERELYPGTKYYYPPKQDKLNPLLIDRNDFFDKIPDDFAKYSFKAVMNNFRGIGPDMAREIIYRAGLEIEQAYAEYSAEDKERIWLSFKELFARIKQGNFKPVIGVEGDGNISYLSAYPLTHRQDQDIDKELYFEDTGSLLDYYYKHKLKTNRLKQEQAALQSVVEKYLTKNSKKQEQLRSNLKNARNADQYKKYGELITANIYRMERGKSEIEVIDYFDQEQRTITIDLDPRLNPAENAQRYYKKYNKAKKSVKHLKRQLALMRHEEKYLNQVLLNIEQAENRSELAEIREELKEENYIKEKQRQKGRKNKQATPLPPHQFKSTQGYDILVGRNNRQNDYLTKKMANKEDLWLHIKDEAGSHVIIRNHTRDEIPAETIREAASLAAFYSKGRMSENVPIDFTEVKNVRKPKGAKPGLVYYDNYQTLYVTPDQELVNRLKKN